MILKCLNSIENDLEMENSKTQVINGSKIYANH